MSQFPLVKCFFKGTRENIIHIFWTMILTQVQSTSWKNLADSSHIFIYIISDESLMACAYFSQNTYFTNVLLSNKHWIWNKRGIYYDSTRLCGKTIYMKWLYKVKVVRRPQNLKISPTILNLLRNVKTSWETFSNFCSLF